MREEEEEDCRGVLYQCKLQNGKELMLVQAAVERGITSKHSCEVQNKGGSMYYCRMQSRSGMWWGGLYSCISDPSRFDWHEKTSAYVITHQCFDAVNVVSVNFCMTVLHEPSAFIYFNFISWSQQHQTVEIEVSGIV